MKYLIIGFAVLTILLIALIPGCKKDEGPAASIPFVDGYTVTLTEPAGTPYTGDFFPIIAGYTSYYTGHVNIYTTTNIPGYTPSTDSLVSPAIGYLRILSPLYITLTSGTYLLYPVADESSTGDDYSADTSRFFMKDTGAVFVKAVKLSDGSYMEVTNPLFLKSTLVVGDSWETAPEMDMAQLSSEFGSPLHMALDAKAKFFVVGKEQIALPIGTRNAVRMEQATDATLTGTTSMTDPDYGVLTLHITMTMQLSNVYHLLADTGIVHQNTTGPINTTVTAQGMTATVNVVINESDLRLESVNIFPQPVAKHGVAAEQSRQFRTRLEAKAWEISKALTNLLVRKLRI